MFKFKNTYWIPTNRNVEKSIKSYVEEISYWYKLSGQKIPLIILDSGNSEIELANHLSVESLACLYPELPIYHISLYQQQQAILSLLKSCNLDAELLELIAPTTSNYGALMNKIALFACMLGSEVIHRRDSDTTLQANCPFPLEYEVNALNFRPETLALTGSSYVGEWNMELKPFLKKDPTLFNTFWSCLNVDERLHQSIFDYVDEGSRAYYTRDVYKQLKEGDFALPDAGNFAIKNIFRLLPSLPSHAMSADYSLLRFSRGSKVPMLYHNRRVVHEYHKERKDNVDPYLTSMLKYCDLRPIYTELEVILSETENSMELLNNGTQIQDVLANALEKYAIKDFDKRKLALENFLFNFIAKCYPKWSKSKANKLEQLLFECEQDYLNHAALIRHWKALINAANNCSQDDVLKLLDKSEVIALV